MADIFIWREV